MTSRPLEGTLVVDLSRYLPGPLTAKMLANLGARVIKIEEPELGDPVRGAPPFEDGKSTLARLLLLGVESVALDLRKEGAREVLFSLLASADVLVESFRPAKLAEFGLPTAELSSRFPKLVICSISGWGSSGPASGQAGHDLTYQAAAGALAATGEMPGIPAADLLGAFAAVSAVNAALFSRERTGNGAVIDASLFDAAAIGNLTNVAARGGTVGEPTPLAGAYPCYRIYDTRDGGRFALAALEPRFWKRLCREIDRPDLVAHQYRRQPASHDAVAEVFASRDGAAWRDLCVEADVPGELVVSIAEAGQSPQMVARGLSLAEGRLAFPGRLDGERPESGASFPSLGEHTADVVEEFAPELAGQSRRARRAAGIGAKRSLKRAVGGWAAQRYGG